MDFKTIRFSIEENIGLITITRPEALNALNRQVLTELRALVQDLAGRKDLRAAILTKRRSSPGPTSKRWRRSRPRKRTRWPCKGKRSCKSSRTCRFP